MQIFWIKNSILRIIKLTGNQRLCRFMKGVHFNQLWHWFWNNMISEISVIWSITRNIEQMLQFTNFECMLNKNWDLQWIFWHWLKVAIPAKHWNAACVQPIPDILCIFKYSPTWTQPLTVKSIQKYSVETVAKNGNCN